MLHLRPLRKLLKILTLSHMFPTPEEGTQGTFIIEQIKALRKFGVTTTTIVPTPWAPRALSILSSVRRYGRIPKAANMEGIPVTFSRFLAFPGRRLFFLYGVLCYLGCRGVVRKHIREERIDLIHAHTIMPDGLAALLLGGEFNIPVVCTVHGSDISIYPHESWATLLVTKWALRQCKHLIAVSEDLAKKINLLIGAHRVTVARNGADEELFRPTPKSVARTLLGLPSETKVLLFIGNLLPVKGPAYILEAVSQLNASDVSLYIIGDGMLRANLRARAEQLGISAQCVFVGQRPHKEIALWLSAADCLAISSISEGFPTIIPEAMMCRIPIVATAVGGIPEVIKHSSTGLLVEPKEPGSLAEAIRLALQDNNKIGLMVDRAEELVRAELTWEANARKTVDVYREALSEKVPQCNAISATMQEANTRYSVKRFLDLCVAVPAAVLTAPLMLLTSMLVALFLGTPILFRQQRPGRNGIVFTILKFRTMTQEVGPDGELLPDNQRLTSFGRFLRRSSLDELPELINVFRVDMSIVGPRPLVIRYLERYSSDQMRRHDVNPGITGWAQVNGRNALSWDQKLAMDVWYVDHQSVWLDIKIMVLTAWALLTQHGIDEPGQIGSSEFLGNRIPGGDTAESGPCEQRTSRNN